MNHSDIAASSEPAKPEAPSVELITPESQGETKPKEKVLTAIDYEKIIREACVPWNLQDILRYTMYPSKSNLNIHAIGTGTDKTATITADYLSVEGVGFASVSLTLTLASTGKNALDTGTIANSSWYAIWAITDSHGSELACTAHVFTDEATMNTRPTMPAGFTLARRIGAVFSFTDASRLVPSDQKQDWIWVYDAPAFDHYGSLLKQLTNTSGRATGGATAWDDSVVAYYDPV